ncbi:MAG: hypothetical protein LBQ43_03105 [Holosporales bacterium]|jgi:hypothetical protein|nr:hypothetical protein [Holosporales bacterium]
MTIRLLYSLFILLHVASEGHPCLFEDEHLGHYLPPGEHRNKIRAKIAQGECKNLLTSGDYSPEDAKYAEMLSTLICRGKWNTPHIMRHFFPNKQPPEYITTDPKAKDHVVALIDDVPGFWSSVTPTTVKYTFFREESGRIVGDAVLPQKYRVAKYCDDKLVEMTTSDKFRIVFTKSFIVTAFF